MTSPVAEINTLQKQLKERYGLFWHTVHGHSLPQRERHGGRSAGQLVTWYTRQEAERGKDADA